MQLMMKSCILGIFDEAINEFYVKKASLFFVLSHQKSVS